MRKGTITPADLRRVERWFRGFARPRRGMDEQSRRNYDLKYRHTLRVRRESISIGKELGLDVGDLRLVELIALLHDAGRFAQFTRHRTLVDIHSEDHAALGVKVISESGVISFLKPPRRALVLRVIAFHNRPAMPRKAGRRTLFFTRLLRDADKLDNYDMITRYYSRLRAARIHAFELGLPDTPVYSKKLYRDVATGKTVSLSDLRTLSELKLLLAGWIHDVNFAPTFRKIRKRRYLDLLERSLPRDGKIGALFAGLRAFLDRKCGE